MAEDNFEDTAVWDRATLVGGLGAAEPQLRVLRATPAGYETIRLRSRGPTTLGRSNAVNIWLQDPSVSRRHAELELSGDRLTLTDLGSRHGTYANGERLKKDERRQLQTGDRFALAGECFKVELRYSSLPGDDGLAAFRRAVELALVHVKRNADVALAVLSIVMKTASDMDRLRDALAGEIRVSDALLAADREVLVLVQAVGASSVERAAERLTRLARVTADDVSVGVAMYSGNDAGADALIAAACAAAKQTCHLELTIGKTTVLVADPAMRALYQETIPAIAVGDQTVLVTGETGVGKELVARRIHETSGRPGCLVTVNCAAVPDNLLESEFFGHEAGAFTGANARTAGFFEEADGGTLFLDEIADLSPRAQATLLRALDTGEVQTVGSHKSKHFNVRVIAATNRDLAFEVRQRRFREDLYYRLHVNVLAVPPLRERISEILLLANHFLRDAAERAGPCSPRRISDEASSFLQAQPWDGNVRQLQHVMQSAVVHGSEVLGVEHFAAARSSAPPEQLDAQTTSASKPTGPPTPPTSLRCESGEYARRRISAVMEKHGGNQSRAAEELGLPRSTLRYKLQALGIGGRGGRHLVPKVRH